MVWITKIKSTGKIHEMQGHSHLATMEKNAQADGFQLADVAISEVTMNEYTTMRDADLDVIASKALSEDEGHLANRKVLLSMMFDLVNKTRVLEGKNPITKRQFINNLKSRR